MKEFVYVVEKLYDADTEDEYWDIILVTKDSIKAMTYEEQYEYIVTCWEV